MASDTAVGGLCVNSPRDLRERERVAVDNNAFLGVWGFTPERAKGTALALRHLFFFALCKFYRFSIGVL